MIHLIIKKIRYKITFSAVIISSLMALVLIVFNYLDYKKKFEEFTFKELKAVGVTLASHLDMQAHDSLASSLLNKDDVNNEKASHLYDLIQKDLEIAQLINDIETPIYTLQIKNKARAKVLENPKIEIDNATEFIVTSAKNPYYKHGYIWKAEMAKAFFENKVSFVAPFHDDHGHWVSVYVPLSYEGEVLAVLALDRKMDYMYSKLKAELYTKLLVLAGVLIMLTFIFMSVAKSISDPIQRLKKQAEAFGEGDYETPIHVESQDEVGVLSRVLNDSRNEIQAVISRILNTSPALMLSIDKDGLIDPHYSRKDLLGEGLALKHIDSLFEEGNQKLSELIPMIFADQLAIPLKSLLELAPSKLKIKSNSFRLEYIPFRKNGEVEGMFISGRDVTLEEALEEKSIAQRQHNQMMINIIKTPKLFEMFVEESQNGIMEARSILEGALGEQESILLQRILHTLKGGASSFGMSQISSRVHKFENDFPEWIINKDKLMLADAVSQLEDMLNHVQGEISRLLGESNLNLSLSPLEYQFLKKSLDEIKSEDIKQFEKIKDLKAWVSKLSQESLNEYIIPKVKSIFERTLESFPEKQIELHFDVENLRVEKHLIQALDVCLPHLIRNSLDHGIENQKQRVHLGKSQTATLSVSAKLKENCWVITVEDDGGGIDCQKIRLITKAKGLIKTEKLDSMSDLQVQELIFEAGFSTTDVISDISGQGLGMNAVKATVEDSGGEIEVTSILSEGTTIRLIFS
ncbi:ATP-binding protein [Fibrobacterales bacterium]|nr:ATP-binding protein [Fibrobacterales bacterium]